MKEKNRAITRRGFFKIAGTAGLGATLSSLSPKDSALGGPLTEVSALNAIPQRPYGATGEKVSILGLGGVLKESDQLVFRHAIKKGVTYWDTADSYGWGKNEQAIGKYFARYPQDRQKIFLVTKAATSDPEKLTAKLNTSLQRMNTSYVDMYLIHYVGNVSRELTHEVKAWSEKAKAQGQIRFFGFSAHKNMESSMLAAAKLGWIDGIMMSYNYRLMGTNKMKRAVDACVKAGIGLTAMKTQAAFSANFYASVGTTTDESLKMTEKFLKKGYTAEQAKLKVVWENPNIASICSAMPTMTILQANTAAALNEIDLSAGDKKRLERYAHLTAPGYCAGCADICEKVVELDVPIGDLLRCAMYYHGYGDREAAAKVFQPLPSDIKASILKADFHKAEKACPQNIQIGRILRKIHADLA